MTLALYDTAANALTYQEFDIYLPVHAVNKHQDVIDGLLDPLYQPLDVHEPVLAKKTLVQMANFRDEDIFFEFRRELDFIAAYGLLNAYLDEAPDYMHLEGAELFVRKVVKLRSDMGRGRKKILNRHPELEEQIYGISHKALRFFEKYLDPSGTLTLTRQERDTYASAPVITPPPSLHDRIGMAQARQAETEARYRANPSLFHKD